MPNYRRSRTKGGVFFFTVVSHNRLPIFKNVGNVRTFRNISNEVRDELPFKEIACVILHDHIHSIWKLPDSAHDFSKRWGIIKRRVSLDCAEHYKKDYLINASKKKHRESTIWQRRFWEHQIRDQNDLNRHIDYIHYNPVKHGLCKRPAEWQYSTLHKYIKEGVYPDDWAVQSNSFDGGVYGE